MADKIPITNVFVSHLSRLTLNSVHGELSHRSCLLAIFGRDMNSSLPIEKSRIDSVGQFDKTSESATSHVIWRKPLILFSSLFRARVISSYFSYFARARWFRKEEKEAVEAFVRLNCFMLLCNRLTKINRVRGGKRTEEASSQSLQAPSLQLEIRC